MHRLGVTVVTLLVCIGASAEGLGRPPLFLSVPPPEIVFTSGTNITLECMATGEPMPTYSWLKDDTFIVEIESLGDLFIRQLSEQDEGVYQCVVNNTYGVAVTHRIFLTMASLGQYPQNVPVEQIPKHVLSLGEPLTLVCPPLNDSYPFPQISWMVAKHDEGSYTPTTDWELVELGERVMQDVKGALHFVNLQAEDAGKLYECEALSPLAKPSSTQGAVQAVDLRTDATPLKELKPVPMSTPDLEMMFLFGDVIHLQCIFGGLPTPSVTWRKVNDTMPEKAMVFPHSNELVIPNATYYDQGTYECEVANDVGSEALPINVFIDSSPYFVGPWVPFIDGLKFGFYELECPVYGVPPVAIMWYKDGLPIYPNPDSDPFQLIRGEYGEKLVFENAVPEMTGVYQCNATNVHGNIFANSYVNVLDCPVCPQQAIPVCGSDGDTYNNECYVKMKNCIEKTEVGIVHCGECTNRTDVQTVGVPVAPQEVHLQSCSNGMNKKLKEEEAVAEIILAPASGFCVPIINYIVEVLNTSTQNAEWEMLYDDVPGDWFRLTARLPIVGTYRLRLLALSEIGVSEPSLATAECPPPRLPAAPAVPQKPPPINEVEKEKEFSHKQEQMLKSDRDDISSGVATVAGGIGLLMGALALVL